MRPLTYERMAFLTHIRSVEVLQQPPGQILNDVVELGMLRTWFPNMERLVAYSIYSQSVHLLRASQS
jgi:hypothetical protein